MKANYITTIGGIAEIYDGPHATPKKLEQGPYFLSISSLDKGRLELNKSAFLSEDDFKKWTKRVTPQEGDLLFLTKPGLVRRRLCLLECGPA